MSVTCYARIVSALVLAAIVICTGANLGYAQETESQEAPAQDVEIQETDAVLENAKRQYDEFRERTGDIRTRSVMTTPTAGVTMTATTVAYYKEDKSRIETVVEYASTASGGGTGRGSFEADPTETIFLRDGADVWLVAAKMPKRKLQGQEAGAYETEHDWWSRIPGNAKMAGEEELGGRDCYIVKVTMRRGEKPVTAWLDKETLVFVGGEGPYQGKWMRWINSDFREVEGRQVSYKTEFFVKEKAVGAMIVESLELDAELSDDLFDPTKLLGPQERAMEAFYEQAQQAQE
jgi:hypothetical protein